MSVSTSRAATLNRQELPRVSAAADVATLAPVATGPFLLASDGSAAAAGAFVSAARLAAALGASVQVLGVVEPWPMPTLDGAVIPPPDIQDRVVAELREMITDQVSTVVSEGSWPLDVTVGPPALVIARRAHDIQARAIVLGLGRHHLLDRIFGSETALQVLRLADVPVLAVDPQFNANPERIAVGVDFSDASLRAARLAIELFPSISVLDLVHVAPLLTPTVVATPWESAYGAELTKAFREFHEALHAPNRILVETITLRGRPAERILAYAEQASAELIVVGSHGLGFVERMIVGSVATGIIRRAKHGVLAVPILEVDGGDAGESP